MTSRWAKQGRAWRNRVGVMNKQQTTKSNQPTTNNKQTNNKQQTPNKQQTTNNKTQAANNRQRTTNSKEQITNNKYLKHHPTSDQKSFKIDPKSVQNRSQVGPTSVQNLFRTGMKLLLGPWGVPGPFWAPKNLQKRTFGMAIWKPHWSQVGVMLVEKLIFVGPGWRSKTSMSFETVRNRFGVDFGAIWGSKMDPKSCPNLLQERSWRKCKNAKNTRLFF